MEKKALELLKDAPWDQIIPKLLKYALNKIYLKYFYTNGLLQGRNPKDVANDVVMGSIKKVFDGTRSWNPDEKDNIPIHLKSIIKSEISHLDDNEEFRATERLPTKQASDSDDPIELEESLKKANPFEGHSVDTTQLHQLGPEEILEMKEMSERNKAAEINILKRVDGDPELEDIVLCILDGMNNPREIAAKLGVEVKDIYNRQKRLRRIYKDIHEQIKKGGM